MKITAIETIPVDRYLFVQVQTDAGLTGLGESGTWGFLEASAQAVETFKRYLIGQDPLRIAHWDIAGKHFGVPCYQLLGGKTRDKARVYYHVFGHTREELVRGCVEAKE